MGVGELILPTRGFDQIMLSLVHRAGRKFGVLESSDFPEARVVVRPVTWGLWFLPFLHAEYEAHDSLCEPASWQNGKGQLNVTRPEAWGQLGSCIINFDADEVLFRAGTLLFRHTFMHVVPPQYLSSKSEWAADPVSFNEVAIDWRLQL